MYTDSDDYVTDESKKRSAEDNLGGRVEKSRKTHRTPTKQQRMEEDKLDTLISMMKDMKQDQTLIKNELQQLRIEQKKFSDEIMSIKKENELLREENNIIKQENMKIKQDMNDLKKNMEWLEKDKKKNNIVMSGLDVDKINNETMKTTLENFISKNLKVDIKIKSTAKLSSKTCLIEMANEEDKYKVMKNKSKLRNLSQQIFINNDLTKQERNKHKQMKVIAAQEKNKGKNVKIGYNRIVVEGEEWRWNKNNETLEKRQAKN